MRMLEEIYPEDQLFHYRADSILEIERWKDCEDFFAAIRFSWEDARSCQDAELAEFAEYLCREYQADVRIIDIESGYFLYRDPEEEPSESEYQISDTG